MILKYRRAIYESFWKQGQLPITRSIKFTLVEGDKIHATAQCADIPVELFPEYTVESLQTWVDALPEPKVGWLDTGIPA